MRTVLASLNGQTRPLTVPDRKVTVDVPQAEKAEPGRIDHIAAPFAGIVTLTVSVGDKVEAGSVVAIIEAMKMEAAITATQSGTVSRVAMSSPGSVEAGDLIMVVD